jgi:hypothetical protein
MGEYMSVMRDLPVASAEGVFYLRSRLLDLHHKTYTLELSSQVHMALLEQMRTRTQLRLKELDYEVEESTRIRPIIGRFDRLMEVARKGLLSSEQVLTFQQELRDIRHILQSILPVEIRSHIVRLRIDNLSNAVDNVLQKVDALIQQMDEAEAVNLRIERFNRLMENLQTERRSYAGILRFRAEMIELRNDIGKIAQTIDSQPGKNRMSELAAAVENVLTQLSPDRIRE